MTPKRYMLLGTLVFALAGCENGLDAPGPAPTPAPPPVDACSGDCFEVIQDPQSNNPSRKRLVNKCDVEMNVDYCVAPPGQGDPSCSSPNSTSLDPDRAEDTGVIRLSGPEATIKVCGCEVPKVVKRSDTDPWDGTGTCVDP